MSQPVIEVGDAWIRSLFCGDCEGDESSRYAEAVWDEWITEHDRLIGLRTWGEGYECGRRDGVLREESPNPYKNDIWEK